VVQSVQPPLRGARPSMVADRPVYGLFINTTKAKCSIYQSGCMVHENIRRLGEFVLDYIELNQIDAAGFNNTGVLRRIDGSELVPREVIGRHYDFIVFNFHPQTMQPYISPEQIAQLQTKKFAIVLEVEPSNAYAFVEAEVFDALIVLDPTIQPDGKAWPFPRPLDGVPRRPAPKTAGIPTIGSFGLGTPGKGFGLLMSAINLEFDEAKVRINIPPSTYADDYMDRVHRRPYAEYLGDLCRRIAKPGINLEVTHDFMSEVELLDWCEDNDINCFLYTRRQSGLAATTDQAIIAGRPLLISANDTFRHIHPYILPYPHTSLRSALEESLPGVYAMQEDWSSRAFGSTFLDMLRALNVLQKQDAWEASPTHVAAARVRPRTLVGIPRSSIERTLLDWEERVVEALRKSVLIGSTVVTLQSASALRTAVFWSCCDALLIVQEHAELAADMENALQTLAANGLCVKRVCRDFAERRAAEQPWEVLGPVIPFFTLIPGLPDDRPIVNCYGFESGAWIPDVVGKVQRELGSADIRIHVVSRIEETERVQLEQRLALLQTQLLPTPGVTVTLAPLDGDFTPMMVSLGSGSCNVFSGGSRYLPLVQNVLDLAMAVDRPVCQTTAQPMPGYEGKLPLLETQSIPTLIEEGMALQAPVYNLYSEGRTLMRLEQLLDVDLTQPCRVSSASSAPHRKMMIGALPIIEPNGVIGDNAKEQLIAVASSVKTSVETVDRRYRPGSLVQQGYLLQAIETIQARPRAGEMLLIGDPGRQAVAALDELGYKFDLCLTVESEPHADRQYHLIAFVNAVSGPDELELALEIFEKRLVPNGLGMLTFFHCDSYNVCETALNSDFPMLTKRDLEKVLRGKSALLMTVTEPQWWSDPPILRIDPFAMPPFGTLTVARTSNANGSAAK
jgi:hypothetical protein